MTANRRGGAQPLARYGVLGAVALVAWALIWGYFRITESDTASTWWWTAAEVRLWLDLGIYLLAPIVIAAGLRGVTRSDNPLVATAAAAAVVVGAYVGHRFASPLEYDNGLKIVYPAFAFYALGIASMGMIIPVALRWRAVCAPER